MNFLSFLHPLRCSSGRAFLVTLAIVAAPVGFSQTGSPDQDYKLPLYLEHRAWEKKETIYGFNEFVRTNPTSPNPPKKYARLAWDGDILEYRTTGGAGKSTFSGEAVWNGAQYQSNLVWHFLLNASTSENPSDPGSGEYPWTSLPLGGGGCIEAHDLENVYRTGSGAPGLSIGTFYNSPSFTATTSASTPLVRTFTGRMNFVWTDLLLPCNQTTNKLVSDTFPDEGPVTETLSQEVTSGVKSETGDDAWRRLTGSTTIAATNSWNVGDWSSGGTTPLVVSENRREVRAHFCRPCAGKDPEVILLVSTKTGSGSFTPYAVPVHARVENETEETVAVTIELPAYAVEAVPDRTIGGVQQGRWVERKTGDPLDFERTTRLDNIVLKVSAGDCNDDCATGRLGSIDWSLGLGRLANGVFAGSIKLHEASFSPRVFTAAALTFVPSGYSLSDLQSVLRTDESLRQVRTGSRLFDVVSPDEDPSLPAASFEVRTYLQSAATPSSGDPDLWVPSGTPLERVRFFSPNQSSADNHLRIERFLGASSQPFSTLEYAFAGTTWTLTEQDERRTDRTTTSVVPGEMQVTTSVWDLRLVTPVLASKVQETVKSLEVDGFTLAVVTERTLDPDGITPLVSSFTYNAEGQLTSSQSYRGEILTYDYPAEGSLTVSRIRGNPADNRTRTFKLERLNYVTDPAYVTSESATWLETEKTLTAVQVGGQRYTLTRIRRDVRGSGLETEYFRTHATGPFVGREAYHLAANGVLTLTTYSIDPSTQRTTTVVSRGAPGPGETAVLSGTRTTTVTNPDGQLSTLRVEDISSGKVLDEQIIDELLRDDHGRPTVLQHFDGSLETRTYSPCCGLLESTTRHGISTTYTYDALRRKVSETVAGVTTQYAYDALDRVVETKRIGTDDSEIVLSTATYDLPGRLVATTDARGATTTYAEVYNPDLTTLRTTTRPDASTVIELLNPDGSPQRRTGTAVAPAFWAYTRDSFSDLPTGFIDTTEYRGDSDAASEWVRTRTNGLGQVVLVQYPDGAKQTTSYNDGNQLAKQVDPDGVTRLFAYNAEGELEIEALDLNRNGQIDYAGGDRIVKTVREVVAAHGTDVVRTTTSVWADTGADTPEVVSVSETATNGLQSWETRRGLTTPSQTPPRELTTHTQISHPISGTRHETSTAPDGTVTKREFVNGRLASTTVSHPALSPTQLSQTTLTYDEHGRLESSTDARNGTTSYTYFADDSVHTVETPDPDVASSAAGDEPQTTTYAYDNMGRVTAVTHPDAAVTHTNYHATGAVRFTWGARTYPTKYTYDSQGRLKTLVTWQAFVPADAAQPEPTGETPPSEQSTGRAVTTWNYDAARGWLTSKLDADGKGASYNYTAGGRLSRLVRARFNAQQPVTYAYDAAGQLAQISYPDSTASVAMTFDRLGRLLTRTDAAGTCTYAYQGLTSAVTAETYAGGILDGVVVQRGFDDYLRLESLSAENALSTLTGATYAYDDASRLVAVTDGANTATYGYLANSGLVGSVTFEHDENLRLVTTKTYDQLNRLKSIVSTPSAGSALSYAYAYNAANQRTRVTRENDARWDYGYDALGQVTSAEKRLGDLSATPVPGHAFGYDYDDIGNRLTATSNGIETTYTPNLLNQYASREVPDKIEFMGTADAAATVTLNGNPVSRQGELFYEQVTVNNSSSAQYPSLVVSGVNASVTVNETRRAFVPQTTEAFAYDADGNLTDDARWKYTWDAENRLIAMETQPAAVAVGVGKRRLVFAYDASGRRVSKRVLAWDAMAAAWSVQSSIRFIYDGWNLLAEVDALASNAVVRTHVWGLDLSGSMQGAGGVAGLLFISSHLPTPNSAAYAAAFDGNGNVAGYVDMASGAVAAKWEYSPFGETILAEGPASGALLFRFSTKFTDEETGLLYYGLRYYSPSIGRWPSRDPINEQGGNNLYGFVSNSPIDRIDPIGLKEWFFYVMTEIEKTHGLLVPKAALGIKTVHSFYVDDGTLSISKEGEFSAKTFGFVPSSYSFSRTATKVGCDKLRVTMTGYAKNWANPFLGAIDYSFTFEVDLNTGSIQLQGEHDGFPSYTARAEGGLYYFQETTPDKLYEPMEIKVTRKL